MLKFRFFHSGEFHLGFARKFNFSGDDRYLIVLLNGSTLTIAQHNTNGSENTVTWFQIKKADDIMQPDDLIQVLGAALKTAKEV